MHEDALEVLRRTGWWPIAAVLGLTGALLAVELVEEPGLSAPEILLEALELGLLSAAAVGVVVVLLHLRERRHDRLQLLNDLQAARAEGAKWRAEVREHVEGLGRAIDEQFERWDLTPAERDVARLLLKGLSHREIADIRSTSERTVRHQAQAVYQKAGLSGRAALSAFFLEDLLPPADQRRDEGRLDQASRA